ncbi:hypothetical protein LCGC14_0365100 [marine sediment metagenome]|uniref:Uncharacterized protein n=1 Tax=marine sediment metagenome TaxID=412755 RepID=A0A0F9WFF9_9ZZZZ
MKKTIQDNYRVEIYPAQLIISSVKDINEYDKDICQGILADINRHVDNIGEAEVVCDTKDICTHCESIWETEESGEPVCCNEAIHEWIKEQRKSDEKALLNE